MYTYMECFFGWDQSAGQITRVGLTKSEVTDMIESLIMLGGGSYIVLDKDGNILERGDV